LAKHHHQLAADCLLAARGIDSPSRAARVGALIEVEYQLKVILVADGFLKKR
jgi:hypothetical protein